MAQVNQVRRKKTYYRLVTICGPGAELIYAFFSGIIRNQCETNNFHQLTNQDNEGQ